MFSKQTISEISSVAEFYGHDPAAFLAVAQLESGGRAFAEIGGRREPLIRFEGHYFDARLSGSRRELARSSGLAHPRAGRIPNPQTQAGRWRLVGNASEIDRRAAWEATSWGLGQVMGAHWKMLGFGSVDDFVHEARSGAAGQTRLMAGYIEKAGLDNALARCDWRAFARGYNGPAFAKNRYDVRLDQAWRSYRGVERPSPPMLRFGASGKEVEQLQRVLKERGMTVVVDGRFGRSTQNAVRKFQRLHGLGADGIVGPATRRMLASLTDDSRPGWLEILREMLKRGN